MSASGAKAYPAGSNTSSAGTLMLAPLLRLNSSRRHYALPFRNFGADMVAKFLRCRSNWIDAILRKALPDVRHPQNSNYFLVELRNHRTWSSDWSQYPVPAADLKFGHAGFRDCRQVRHRWRTRCGADGKCPDATRLHVRCRLQRCREQDVDLPGKQVRQGRSAALVRNVNQVRTRE